MPKFTFKVRANQGPYACFIVAPDQQTADAPIVAFPNTIEVERVEAFGVAEAAASQVVSAILGMPYLRSAT